MKRYTAGVAMTEILFVKAVENGNQFQIGRDYGTAKEKRCKGTQEAEWTDLRKR